MIYGIIKTRTPSVTSKKERRKATKENPILLELFVPYNKSIIALPYDETGSSKRDIKHGTMGILAEILILS